MSGDDACPGQERFEAGSEFTGRTDWRGSEKTERYSTVGYLSFTVSLQNASGRLSLPAFQYLIFHKHSPVTSSEDSWLSRVEKKKS